jgi:hypothetical protein
VEGGGTRHGTSSGWSSASASEPAEGSDPEPAQTRILRQPFLERVMGEGGRGDRSLAPAARPARRRLSQSSRALSSAALVRAFLESGRGTGRPLCLCCFYAAAALLVCLRLCTPLLLYFVEASSGPPLHLFLYSPVPISLSQKNPVLSLIVYLVTTLISELNCFYNFLGFNLGNIFTGNRPLHANYGNFNPSHTILIRGRSHGRWKE